VLCATTADSPLTQAPTAVTSVPTEKPTVEPSSSIVDMQSLEALAFNNPENATVITKSIPLSRFVIDYYLLPNEKGRERRTRSLRGEENTIFTTAIKLEVLNFVSDHLVERLEIGLEDVQSTDIELAVLNTHERTDVDGGERVASYEYAGNMMYQSSVNVITASILNSEVLNAFNGIPGKTAFLARLQSSRDKKFLSGVTNVKARLADGGIDEDDTSLSSTAAVVVDDESNSNTLVNVQDRFSNDLVQAQEGFRNASSSSMSVAIIAICAFVIITVIGGFVVASKYKQYRRNNDNNDYVNYQNRKREVTMTLTPRSIKIKSYFNFDTPNDGRSVAGADDNLIYDDLEIIGGDTYPSSQEHVDYDNDDDDDENSTRPLGARFDRQQGLQFDPVCDVSLIPYDEKVNTTIEGSSGIGMAARNEVVVDGDSSTQSSMIYFSHIANQLSNDQLDMMSLNESHDEHRTVDDLYSDKDSYFNSYNIVGKNHSFDTLDSLFDVNQSISHLIDGIENMLDRKEKEEENPALSPDSVHINPIDSDVILPSNLLTMLDTTTSTTATDGIHIGDVYEEQLMDFDKQCENLCPDEELVANNDDEQNLEDEAQMVLLNKLKFLNGNMDSSIQIEDENKNTCKYLQVLGASQRGADGSGYYVDDDSETVERDFEGVSIVSLDKFISDSDDSSIVNSSISATDELFARIADLEHKILTTENQFALGEKVKFDKLSNAVTALEVDNPVTVVTPLPSPSSSSSVETRNVSTIMSSSVLQLEFTKETLAMMQQRRLDCTPPPSDGDVDSEARKMVQEAQNNCLLGKFLDDTDSEEDESTIYELS
jgi:hypothetical protein